MMALDQVYKNLIVNAAQQGAARTNTWGGGAGGTGAPGGMDSVTTDADVIYHDPDHPDGVRPYGPGLTEAEIRREQLQEAKARRKDQRLRRKQERDARRYDRWVLKQLGVSKRERANFTMTPAQFEKYVNGYWGVWNCVC